MTKKILYGIGGILLILIVTNPGNSSFLRFLDEQEFSNEYREANYIVCGVYSVEGFTAQHSAYKNSYFAILGKFHRIK
jgi:hypothetical protein